MSADARGLFRAKDELRRETFLIPQPVRNELLRCTDRLRENGLIVVAFRKRALEG